MRIRSKVTTSLLGLLGLTMGLRSNPLADAYVLCDEINGCRGLAACYQLDHMDGCIMHCVSGSKVHCLTAS